MKLKAAVLAAVAVVSLSVGAALTLTFADDSSGGPPVGGAATSTQLPISSVTSTAFTDLVERVSESVVTIHTVVGSGVRQGLGTGTGIVLDEDGNIVTNYHVVEGAREVSVEFVDGTVLAGTVIRSDESERPRHRAGVGARRPARPGDVRRLERSPALVSPSSPLATRSGSTSR